MPDQERRENLADRIKLLTPDRGDTPKLAEKAGIPVRTLSNWRENRGEPDTTQAAKIADVAGVHLLWLATGKGPKSSSEELLTLPPLNAIECRSLREALLIVDTEVLNSGRVLSAEQFLRVVAAVYDEIVTAAGPVPVERVQRYLKVVA